MMKDGKRELLIGAVGLVKGSVRYGGAAMVRVCDELEPEFNRTKFLDPAPFKAVSLVLRYGTKWGMPDVGKVNNRHSELEVGIEIPMSEIRSMDQGRLVSIVKKATLQALLAIAEKYGLDGETWKDHLVLTAKADERLDPSGDVSGDRSTAI